MPLRARSTCLGNSVPPTTSEHEKHAVLVRFSCSTCTGSIPTYKHVERARKGTLYVSSTSYHLKTRKTRRFGAFFVFCAAPYPPGHEERAVFARFSWSTFSRSNPRPQTRIMCPSGYVLRVFHTSEHEKRAALVRFSCSAPFYHPGKRNTPYTGVFRLPGYIFSCPTSPFPRTRKTCRFRRVFRARFLLLLEHDTRAVVGLGRRAHPQIKQ